MKEQFKSFFKNKKAVVATVASTLVVSVPQIAWAEEVSSPNVASAMTSAMQGIVTNTLSAISAIAPIGITIFGAMFAWKKGVQFFKGVTK